MYTLSNFFSKFFSLFPERSSQLRDEAEIDGQLINQMEHCPEVLAKYLLHRRKVNREQFEQVDEATVLDKYSVMTSHLEINGQHQQEIRTLLNQNCDPCQFLSQFHE